MNFRTRNQTKEQPHKEWWSFLSKKITLYQRSNERLGNILKWQNIAIDYAEDKTGQNVYVYIKTLGTLDEKDILSIENNTSYELLQSTVKTLEELGYKNLWWIEVHPLEQIKIGDDYDFMIHFNK